MIAIVTKAHWPHQLCWHCKLQKHKNLSKSVITIKNLWSQSSKKWYRRGLHHPVRANIWADIRTGVGFVEHRHQLMWLTSQCDWRGISFPGPQTRKVLGRGLFPCKKVLPKPFDPSLAKLNSSISECHRITLKPRLRQQTALLPHCWTLLCWSVIFKNKSWLFTTNKRS